MESFALDVVFFLTFSLFVHVYKLHNYEYGIQNCICAHIKIKLSFFHLVYFSVESRLQLHVFTITCVSVALSLLTCLTL